MATATHTTNQITLEAYLNSIFHPDMEYVDGELKERNVGSYEHSRLQALITQWFGNSESAWGVQVVTEQRTRTSDTNILIPDVALLPRGPQPRVIAEPPILAVEILSPEDRYSEMTVKIRKFLQWGVRSVWIVDPDEPVGQMWTAPLVCTAGETLTVEGTQIYLELAELFKALKSS
jgi:Uma2 family endonuclease